MKKITVDIKTKVVILTEANCSEQEIKEFVGNHLEISGMPITNPIYCDDNVEVDVKDVDFSYIKIQELT